MDVRARPGFSYYLPSELAGRDNAMRKANATVQLPCSARLLLPPLQKLTEQRFAIGLAFWSTGSDAIQKNLEIALDICLSRSRRAVETLKHLLGDKVSCPARNRGP